jgi:hypothetical protein
MLPVDLSVKQPWRWLWVPICVAYAIGAIALLLPGEQRIHWVGSKDLDIRFLVAAAESGRPIEGAQISVHQECSSLCENCAGHTDFELTAGTDGTAVYHCGACMCGGTKGPSIDTFFIHLPSWYFWASADGFEASAITYLDELPYQRQVQRGDAVAHLDVTIKLPRKSK